MRSYLFCVCSRPTEYRASQPVDRSTISRSVNQLILPTVQNNKLNNNNPASKLVFVRRLTNTTTSTSMPLMGHIGPGRAGLFVYWARPGRAVKYMHLNGPGRAGPKFCQAALGRAEHFQPVQSTSTEPCRSLSP